MNLFYAPPNQIDGEHIELLDQEARHAARVLRYREGDPIILVDGKGGWFEGKVRQILNHSVQIEIEKHTRKDPPYPRLVLGLAVLKKKDRLEFAVEKAVELGVMEIALFRSEHTVKENVRMERLEATALSAMKQSLRAYLPPIQLFDSPDSVIRKYPDHKLLVAHEKSEGKSGISDSNRSAEKLLLMVGPEGGFSEEEIATMQSQKCSGQLVSLGEHRLRTETAAVVFLSQFL